MALFDFLDDPQQSQRFFDAIGGAGSALGKANQRTFGLLPGASPSAFQTLTGGAQQGISQGISQRNAAALAQAQLQDQLAQTQGRQATTAGVQADTRAKGIEARDAAIATNFRRQQAGLPPLGQGAVGAGGTDPERVKAVVAAQTQPKTSQEAFAAARIARANNATKWAESLEKLGEVLLKSELKGPEAKAVAEATLETDLKKIEAGRADQGQKITSPVRVKMPDGTIRIFDKNRDQQELSAAFAAGGDLAPQSQAAGSKGFDALVLQGPNGRVVLDKNSEQVRIRELLADGEHTLVDEKDSDKTRDFSFKLLQAYDKKVAAQQYSKISSSFQDIRNAVNDPSGVGDLAIITGYMKMLDPNSAVLTSEVVTAKNTTGVPQKVLDFVNKGRQLIEGGRGSSFGEVLTPPQRADFLRKATQKMKVEFDTNAALKQRTRNQAKLFKIDPATLELSVGILSRDDLKLEPSRPQDRPGLGEIIGEAITGTGPGGTNVPGPGQIAPTGTAPSVEQVPIGKIITFGDGTKWKRTGIGANDWEQVQ